MRQSETHESLAEIFRPNGLPDASSLLSSRWPEDNSVTCDPVRHYSGAVDEAVTVESLQRLVQGSLGASLRLEVAGVRMGVFTWDVSCKSDSGWIMIQVPRVLDRPAATGRQKALVPHLSAANMAHYLERGLDRYLSRPVTPPRTVDGLPILILPWDRTFRTVTFGSGQIRLDLRGTHTDWVLGLGPRLTAEILIEIVASIAYHYEQEEEGGTTIADLFLNDGDFGVKRDAEDGFALRLYAIRRRESGVSPERLLLYLTQLAAYQDFQVAGSLIGIPTLASNPSIAFEGLVRGRRYRALDLGRDPRLAEEEAHAFLREFSRSEDGRAYEPWVNAFFRGDLAPRFGQDLRECWWLLQDTRERANLARLVAHHTKAEADALRARELEEFQAVCAAKAGRLSPPRDEGSNWNDMSLTELEALLVSVGEKKEQARGIGQSLIKRWPFRDFDHLLSEVPAAKRLRKARGRADFGFVVRAVEEAGSWRRPPSQSRTIRPIANREVFGGLLVPDEAVPAALEWCGTFERYMDAALHDESWGYYANAVEIGAGGHFTTRPEKLSPDYGRWLCSLGYQLYGILRGRGELQADDPFEVVEFGAGNGRMAADLLAASSGSRPLGSIDDGLWAEFSRAVRYRIYERSGFLRDKQRATLGDSVKILPGDARSPGQCLRRDFPDGLRGLILTNELPDAFGTHKLLLTREGAPLAALVLPSISERGLNEASAELSGQILAESAELRRLFPFAGREGAHSMSETTFHAWMTELSMFPRGERARRTLELGIEELYVPAGRIPTLRQHLQDNLEHYAAGLALVDAGVVLYPNAHADRFMTELGERLSAGFVVTIDYGGSILDHFRSARRGDQLFRVFLDGAPFSPVCNDPYGRIGLQDLTTDVNFTTLAGAGQRSGLEVVHYGPERDLTGPFLGELLQRRHERIIAEFLGSPLFKVLIQSPISGELTLGPRIEDGSLFPLSHELTAAENARAHELIETMRRELEL